ncbi:MAG: hypothetical protein Q7R68_10770, partial [Nitrospirales bacterium]|nr:hypothetical protein [Nitrospirales bacterium]
PPSDPGPMMTCLDPGLRTVGLHEARHVPDTRSDESEAAEALDRRLEAALRSLGPLEWGVIRCRYWRGWSWDRIAQFYDIVEKDGGAHFVEQLHARGLRELREALR